MTSHFSTQIKAVCVAIRTQETSTAGRKTFSWRRECGFWTSVIVRRPERDVAGTVRNTQHDEIPYVWYLRGVSSFCCWLLFSARSFLRTILHCKTCGTLLRVIHKLIQYNANRTEPFISKPKIQWICYRPTVRLGFRYLIYLVAREYTPGSICCGFIV